MWVRPSGQCRGEPGSKDGGHGADTRSRRRSSCRGGHQGRHEQVRAEGSTPG